MSNKGKRSALAVLIFGLAVCLSTLSGRAETTTQDGIGTLTVKAGRVEIIRAGATQWGAAEKGALLYEGDRVKTGELAHAAILLDDGSLIRLSANTELALKTKKPGLQKSRLQLLLGRLWAKISKQQESLEIETPSAVAAIKGTTLELSLGVDGQATLTVLDGLVGFSNALGQVLVHAAEQSLAKPGQAPGPAQPVVLKKLDQWFDFQSGESAPVRTLKTTVKDKQGKEYKINLKYKKK